jgi:hypothetical protein
MQNVTTNQVLDIALDILAACERNGIPAHVYTHDVMTRFRNKGIYASLIQVSRTLDRGLTRVPNRDGKLYWTV